MKLQQFRKLVLRLLILIASFPVTSSADTPVVELVIRDHHFEPTDVPIPVNTKVKLLIKNRDPTSEEFESYELKREKVISGNSEGVVFIGPLPAGSYPFFGDFSPDTAQGRVIVE